jgi:transcriptional regulator with XRE-family HTH domain
MATLNLGSLGEYIREQRKTAQYSLRQLAHAAGVSNPYLSQIERGLRKPSAEIMQQIAKALRISAETLYVRAGILDDHGPADQTVTAVLNDVALTERQKRVLIDIYHSFRAENERATHEPGAPLDTDTPHNPPEGDADDVRR